MNKSPTDEFHGQGGSYIVENGVKRVNEQPTRDHPEGNRPRDEHGKPIVPGASPGQAEPAPQAAPPAAPSKPAAKGGDR